MGNRAVVTFDENPTPQSVGIYLHWNGGAESVLAFLEAADKFGVRDNGDPAYQLARVTQIIANFFGGTLCLGVDTLANLDTHNGDNGVFAVSRSGGKITMRQSPDGKTDWKELDLDEIKKHVYWKDNDALNAVIRANEAAFSEKD